MFGLTSQYWWNITYLWVVSKSSKRVNGHQTTNEQHATSVRPNEEQHRRRSKWNPSSVRGRAKADCVRISNWWCLELKTHCH
jgi:hypothetical protein